MSRFNRILVWALGVWIVCLSILGIVAYQTGNSAQHDANQITADFRAKVGSDLAIAKEGRVRACQSSTALRAAMQQNVVLWNRVDEFIVPLFANSANPAVRQAGLDLRAAVAAYIVDIETFTSTNPNCTLLIPKQRALALR